ncbi:hypothetical protein A8F94_22230 [Bacillus sp. FJAT-27225]|uniref:aminoglycoside phosphotransferase family protein n=1 Tax=Bacillus sp. FJAT-27225 TaxID=1743144 RepID=UPI00080C33CF|nr:aminoglycoside phosphotransferase family protein [Bacillus sp. FJAT-27225]OCA81589.1 hypothetical protein A8F94_22230 [Bacillus sp. FJAT-27225]
MDVPKEFYEKVTGAFGNAGEKWLERLEYVITEYERKWRLTISGPVENLSYNYVVKAIDQNGTPVILKLGVPNFDFSNEVQTVRLYKGDGFARLLAEDSENGAMLLERLIPGTNLAELKDEELVTKTFIHVWNKIRRPLSKDVSTPSIMDWANGFTRYRDMFPDGGEPIPIEAIDRANLYLNEINSIHENELLHGDLHHENILLAERGWLAIDPKGVAGSRYFDVVSFLTNYLHEKENPRQLLKQRIDWICEGLCMDKVHLLKASYALGTLYACWSIEDGGDWKETYRCVEWFAEFLSEE